MTMARSGGPRKGESNRVRGVDSRTGEAARQHRRTPTDSERILWDALRERRVAGLKFRRQQPLGPFIVDFCCAEYRLIIEVDGDSHAEQVEYDAARTNHLESYGYRVLRFRNDDVLVHLDAVLDAIADAVAAEHK